MNSDFCRKCGMDVDPGLQLCEECAEEQEQKGSGTGWIFLGGGLLLVVLLAVILAFTLFPKVKKSVVAGDSFEQCGKNTSRIASALKEYKKDHSGCYPKGLKDLVPAYLDEIPSCPVGGVDTYSKSYRVSDDLSRFTFYCYGENHIADGRAGSWPQYSSVTGLMVKPEKVHEDYSLMKKNPDFNKKPPKNTPADVLPAAPC